MATSKYIPSRVQALIQGAIMSWMLGKKQHESKVCSQEISEILLPGIRSVPEVQRWQQNLLTNDLSLVTYALSYILELCREYELLHDIAPVVILETA